MARVVGKLVQFQASGATFTPNFANIVWDSTLADADKAILADDLILTGLSNRQSTGTDFSTPAGYTKIGTYGVQSSTAHIWWYKKAAGGESGSAHTCTSAECIGITLIVRGVDATTQITASSARKDWVNSASFNSDTPVAAAGDLVIHSCAYNNTGQYTRAKLSQLTGLARYDSGNVGLVVGYKQVEPAGAISAVTWYNKNATNGGQAWVICIKTASGAALQPDIRTTIDELNWYGAHGAANTPVPATNAWQKPSTFATGALGSIGGINLSTVALGTIVTTAQPYGTAVGTFSSIPHATNETAWAGAWHTQAAVDLRGTLVAIDWMHDALSASANVGTQGAILVLSDGTNWVAYQLSAKAKGWGLLVPQSTVIAVGNAITLDSSGTIATTLSAVTQIGFFWHRAANSASGISLHVRNLLVIPTTLATTPAYSASLTGGGSSRPANLRDFYTAAGSWDFKALATLQADGQVMPRIDVCFGDGTNKTYVDVSAYPLSFPQAWSAADSGNWQMNWNVDTLALAVAVKTAATDTINLTATGIVAPNKQQLVIDAGSDTGATLSIAGTSVVGMTFTDNAGFALASGTFKNGGTVTLKASATSLNVSKTVGAVPAVAMTANNKTIASSTIDLTGTSATYHLKLPATVTAITMNTVTLSGTPATNKIYSELASGTLTITTDGGGTSLADTDVTFIGGSTAVADIAAPQPTLDATVLANTRVVLYNRTADAEISNTLVAGTSWTHTVTSGASSGDVLDLYTFKEGYAESVATIIYNGVDATFAVQQETDPAIQYYRTQESITDYTTLTEYNFYSPDIYIQADDADGENTIKKLFIFYNGVLTTEDGARYMRGGCTFRSAFDVVINRSAVAMAVDNVSVTHGLHFTDEDVIRVTTDDGTSWIAPPSAPGSIRYAFGVAPGQINTSDQSLNLSTAEQALDNKMTTMAAAVGARAVDGTYSEDEVLKLLAAALAGKREGIGTATETYTGLDGTTVRISLTPDVNGNGTPVLDVT